MNKNNLKITIGSFFIDKKVVEIYILIDKYYIKTYER